MYTKPVESFQSSLEALGSSLALGSLLEALGSSHTCVSVCVCLLYAAHTCHEHDMHAYAYIMLGCKINTKSVIYTSNWSEDAEVSACMHARRKTLSYRIRKSTQLQTAKKSLLRNVCIKITHNQGGLIEGDTLVDHWTSEAL